MPERSHHHHHHHHAAVHVINKPAESFFVLANVCLVISKRTSLGLLELPWLYTIPRNVRLALFKAPPPPLGAKISSFVFPLEITKKKEESSIVLSGSSLLFIRPPELLFDFRRQRVEHVLLHHQGAALQQPTLAQLHRQALQTVASQLQLGQAGQLSETWRQRLQAVVPQVQSTQLLALEQLRGQSLDLERRQTVNQLLTERHPKRQLQEIRGKVKRKGRRLNSHDTPWLLNEVWSFLSWRNYITILFF